MWDKSILLYMRQGILYMSTLLISDIVSDHKRVKLVMQVFRVSNTKYESVAMEKFDAWWHFVQNLDQKASLFFDTVSSRKSGG